MNLTEFVLEVLKEERGQYFSGENLAQKCGVTRNSIWKAVKRLRKKGYVIDAVPSKGYILREESDKLTGESVRAFYKGNKKIKFQHYESVGSTNDLARECALEGAPEWTVILAERQEKGRGRMGRSFFSPAGGAYMSIVLRPHCQAGEANLLTIAAATAVAEAIEMLTPKKAGIKWVNDIFVEGKKVSGILTEAALSLEANQLDYAVVGIGLNVVAPEEGYPEALSTIAGSILTAEEYTSSWRSQLVAQILENFEEAVDHLLERTYIKSYRQHSLVINKEVLLVQRDKKERVFVEDIDSDGALLVKTSNGEMKKVISGEVSLRMEE